MENTPETPVCRPFEALLLAKRYAPILSPRPNRALEILEEERKHLEPAELAAFFRALEGDDFWEPYFRLTYFWGCRVSETALIFAAELREGRIVIRRLKKKESTDKRGKVKNPGGFAQYSYAIPKTVVPYIDRVLAWREAQGLAESAWLFPSRYQGAWKKNPTERMAALRRSADDPKDRAVSRQSAHNRFKKAAKEGDLPLAKHLRRTHVLRHTRATLMYAASVSAENVRYYLGHSDAKTTDVYLHEAEALRARLEHEDIAQLGLEGFLCPTT